MTWAIVFKGTEIHRMYDQQDTDWPGTMGLMYKGLNYVVFSNGDWYCLEGTMKDAIGVPVSKEIVPPELRTIALLLDIPT